jgi:hypothetical protein
VKRILLAIVIGVPTAFVGTTAIWAQDIKPIDVKPGLWENTVTTQMSGMNMPSMPSVSPDQLAKMPPEARARVEAMIKGGTGAPQTSTNKACITKENLSKPIFDNADKSCIYKLVSSSSSTQQIHVECTKGNSKTSGDLSFNRVDNEHLKGNMDMKTTGDASTSGSAAQNMTIKMTFSNKFISSDCGDVKPSMGK